MTERMGPSPDQDQASESLGELPRGLSAVYAPDLTLHTSGGISRGYEQTALTSEQALEEMNKFLRELNDQGAQIVSSLLVETQDNVRRDPVKKTMFVVNKP